jgi:hypothetical protein
MLATPPVQAVVGLWWKPYGGGIRANAQMSLSPLMPAKVQTLLNQPSTHRCHLVYAACGHCDHFNSFGLAKRYAVVLHRTCVSACRLLD